MKTIISLIFLINICFGCGDFFTRNEIITKNMTELLEKEIITINKCGYTDDIKPHLVSQRECININNINEIDNNNIKYVVDYKMNMNKEQVLYCFNTTYENRFLRKPIVNSTDIKQETFKAGYFYLNESDNCSLTKEEAEKKKIEIYNETKKEAEENIQKHNKKIITIISGILITFILFLTTVFLITKLCQKINETTIYKIYIKPILKVIKIVGIIIFVIMGACSLYLWISLFISIFW